MKETKVSIVNESKEKLVGIESTPSIKKDKYPAVLLVHGFGVTKDEKGLFVELAEKLAESGFLVYRFDFSGRGESEGDYIDTSLTKQKNDLMKMLEFVKSQPNVDSTKIGILAQSLGTVVTVALMPKVNAIVLTGAIAHYKEIMGVPFKWEKLDQKGVSKRIKPDGEVILIGPQFWTDLDKYDLLNSIKKIRCPILFIHGSQDEKVPVSEMAAYFAAANEPKQKIIIEGASHSLHPHRNKVYEIAVKWFKTWLK